MDGLINNDFEDNGIDILADELEKLQRQFMLMESNKKAYTEEMGIYLAKQRKMIFTLEQEKMNLLQEVNIVTNKRKKSDTSYLKECLINKWNDFVCANDELNEQKKYDYEIDKEICKIQNELDNKLKQQREPSANRLKTKTGKNINKHEELLENKLHVKTVKFNNVLTENAHLRKEIDHLLVQRSQFNETYKRLVTQLDENKRIIMELIEQATIAYEQREDAQNKLKDMSNEDKQQIAIHRSEVKELQRQYDRDLKLQDFLLVKGQRRMLMDYDEKEKEKKQSEQSYQKDNSEKWSDLIGWLQLYLGEQNVDRIVDLFIRQEEENFALFTYINELNSEVDDLQKDTKTLTSRVEEQKKFNEARAVKQAENMNTLRMELTKLKENFIEEDIKIKLVHSELDKLLSSTEKLFMSINCDDSPIFKVFGGDIHANMYNMSFYVNLIESSILNLTKKHE